MSKTLEQILAVEQPHVTEKPQQKAEKILLNIHLGELRELAQKTQVDLASVLGIKQPSIAEMEKPGRDLKLSSLKRYIEATGGKLRLDVELPDGTHYGFVV